MSGGGAVLGAASSSRPPVSSSSLDLLINAYYEYLLGAGCAAVATAGLAAREDIFERVESVGYRIGRRYAERLARDRERLADALDVMKFICREFWTDVFRKVCHRGELLMYRYTIQISTRQSAAEIHVPSPLLPASPALPFTQPVDKLQTNNKGTFLLQDLNFRWTRYISGSPADEPGAVALKFTVLCCGLLRGALAAFDLNAIVHVDVSALPKAVFQVRTVDSVP